MNTIVWSGMLAAVVLSAAGDAQAATAPVVTKGPVVAGVPEVGATLTATAAWTGDPAPTVMWRWLRCARTADTCSTIGNADTAVYRPASADVGSVLRVRLTLRNSAGSVQVRSNPTAPVTLAATPTPSPSPTPTPTASPTPTATPEATVEGTPTVEATATPVPASVAASAPVIPTALPAAPRPLALNPFPVIRIKGALTPTGARVRLLTVRAPRGVRIVAHC